MKEDLNKLRAIIDIPGWKKKKNLTKMSVPPKLIYKVKATQIKILIIWGNLQNNDETSKIGLK